MAVNSVSVVGPRSQAQRPEKEKRDPIDEILRGLQIAQGITGIAVNYQHIKKGMSENDMLADKRAGIQTDDQRQEAIARGMQPVADGTPGSQTFSYRAGEGPEGVKKQAFILAEKEKAQTGSVQKVKGPNGPMFAYVTGKEEQPYTPYIEPKESKPDTLSKVDYGKAAQAAGDKFRDDAAKPKMAIDAATEAENLVQLARKNPAAAAAAVRKLARASGDSGVMSDADVNAFGGSQAMMDRLDRIFEKAANGTMTQDDVTYATEVAQVLKQNAQVAYDGMAQDAVARFQANFGGEPADIHLRITGRKGGQAAPQNVAGGKDRPPTGDGTALANDKVPGPSLEEIDAALAKKGVKPKGVSGGW